jgi:CheY-like chemotaxis protein
MTERAELILNVDADTVSRAAVSRILRKEGFEVREATTGKEALEMAAGNPALIILDANLPDMTGSELCRRLKSDSATAGVPVLQLTPSTGDSAAPGGAADGYLGRPVEASALVTGVRSLLRLRRAEAEVERQTARVGELEREVHRLEALAAQVPAAVTAALYAAVPLREANPDVFAALASEFAALLDLALEQRQFKVSHPLTERLRAVSDRLGFLRAGPRDVVAVYSAALKARSRGAAAVKARDYVDEGRLLALELMGHLVTYYRLRSVGGRGPGAAEDPGAGSP